MRQTDPVRTRLAPIVVLLPLALAGCSSGSVTQDAVVKDTPSPTASAATSTAPTPTPGKTLVIDPTTGAIAATVAPTTRAAPVAPVTTVAPGKPAATRATAPGRYTLTTSGTISSPTLGSQDAAGTQTLTISALKAGMQHSALHGDQGDTDQDLLVRDTGTYIGSLTITSPALSGTKEFRPSPAVLLVPDPAKVGASWSWGGTSTDGKTKVATTNKITRTETLTIGGVRVPCVVVVTHLVLSGDVSYDAQVTTWYAPTYRLAVKDHTVGKGTYSGIMFTTDITSVMGSVKPA